MTVEASSSAASPHATLQTEATSIGELLREHGSLARGHLVSFCLDDPWSSLPAAWREALLALAGNKAHAAEMQRGRERLKLLKRAEQRKVLAAEYPLYELASELPHDFNPKPEAPTCARAPTPAPHAHSRRSHTPTCPTRRCAAPGTASA